MEQDQLYPNHKSSLSQTNKQFYPKKNAITINLQASENSSQQQVSVQSRPQTTKNERQNKTSSQSFNSQLSQERLSITKAPSELIRENNQSKAENNGVKGMYTPNQVKVMLQQEENQKLQLLNNNYLLQKKQALEYFRNNYIPQSARNSDYKIIKKNNLLEKDGFSNQNAQMNTLDYKNKNSRNFHLNIQDTSHDNNSAGHMIQSAIKTVTIDSNDHQSVKSKNRQSELNNTARNNTQQNLSSNPYMTQQSHYSVQSARLQNMKNISSIGPNNNSNEVSTPNHQKRSKTDLMLGAQTSRKTNMNSQIIQNNNSIGPQTQMTHQSSFGGETMNQNNSPQLNQQRSAPPTTTANFNQNTATYNQSLIFYETQYRDKLKELELERKLKRRLEDRVDELQSAFHQIVNENQKLKEDLKEIMADNKVLSEHFQAIQEQQKMHEPYTNEVEDKNIKLNLEIFTVKEEMKILIDERTQAQRRAAQLQNQVDEIMKENKKWKEANDQLKERMQSIRNINKQLENKANQNWVMMRRNDIFKDTEDRMVKAENRVRELEESLGQFIEDFETLNCDLSICAQKLALAEGRVELLTKKNQELESDNIQLAEKVDENNRRLSAQSLSIDQEPIKEERKPGFNTDDIMKLLETQNIQIITLTKTLDNLRRDNREQFQKTLEQQEQIFNLQSKVQGYENHIGMNQYISESQSSIRETQVINQASENRKKISINNEPQILQIEFNRSSQYGGSNNESQREIVQDPPNQSSPRIDEEQQQTRRNKIFQLQQTFGGVSYTASSNFENELGQGDNDTARGSNTVRSAVKEFSFKHQTSRDFDANKVFEKLNMRGDKGSAKKPDMRQSHQDPIIKKPL
ncbi:UNKNOWN [Stylonychia lemnae]|uniref:Uncharacterized protein n=1 Tax=Stylonychia lemnae TaxID=5949 RepID=A0A077ZVA5_STYLE|nr:UNKNOWN [Stylonychia lemnae]|eukprot:CDW73825.1 UNKNOWN [Stylonychia lemnae]